ncbi:MAG: UDP-glucose/GDP-mannose dehydrogenase family protein [Alicyclobacillus macrosporangiidus]|uniref:UDP-glucose dehydrogenase family protein n=1 Tax=Alicyclobacillus macrosporangiidus TaxID=392015 RepID=UPI0026F22CE5|nr:UDP-glucose/GDP-mannose dehydrogenase family protein [Alicyclobacillus macrosporangiidus]MCL6598842.1 UDP-glucose/GDP-mannose dehydrogenase family protein [Alicyclobacillus macrosporangiidus]
MKVWVIGTGYVGLVTGLCFAKLGHQVLCIDTDPAKIRVLREGKAPFHEPGLAELFQEQSSVSSIEFSEAIPVDGATDVALIAVGTPPLASGAADLRAVFAVVDRLAQTLPRNAVVAIKSTVPVGTALKVRERLRVLERADLRVASVPEFLREGQALHDVFHPSRLIFGVTDERTAGRLRTLHAGLEAPVVVTDPSTAEMIKYASNAFLATKISFINEIANICDRVGADVAQVALGMGLDPRIGPSFLRAGIGYGGSCFPKDTRALVNIAGEAGYDFQLLRAVVEVNQRQRLEPLRRLREWLDTLDGKVITLLGVAFKPGTDDVRESPAVDLHAMLINEGAEVRLVDPVVRYVRGHKGETVHVYSDAYEALEGADAAVLVTEWPEFTTLDWHRVVRTMRRSFFFDGRNVLEPETVRNAGMTLANVGRGTGTPVTVRGSDTTNILRPDAAFASM